VQEGAVELEREDLAPGGRQRDGERAEPGTDLQDAVARSDPGVGDDRAREVRVDQEVLPERLGWPDAVSLGEVAEGGPAEPARLTR